MNGLIFKIYLCYFSQEFDVDKQIKSANKMRENKNY